MKIREDEEHEDLHMLGFCKSNYKYVRSFLSTEGTHPLLQLADTIHTVALDPAARSGRVPLVLQLLRGWQEL